MPIGKYVKPWSDFAVRHFPDLPGRAPLNVYDLSYCGKSAENRWNVAGEPTLYLAKEKDVALAEFARHYQVNRTPGLGAMARRRLVYRFEASIERCIDLREKSVRKSLSLPKQPDCFLDTSITRSTAHFLRNTIKVQGILVPSVAFLDDFDKWCLVLFLENLDPDPRTFLLSSAEDGTFDLT